MYKDNTSACLPPSCACLPPSSTKQPQPFPKKKALTKHAKIRRIIKIHLIRLYIYYVNKIICNIIYYYIKDILRNIKKNVLYVFFVIINTVYHNKSCYFVMIMI